MTKKEEILEIIENMDVNSYESFLYLFDNIDEALNDNSFTKEEESETLEALIRAVLRIKDEELYEKVMDEMEKRAQIQES